MKVFFWMGAATYVVLYFYTAYLYEGFSMTLAIILFVFAVAFFYWRRKRSIAIEAEKSTSTAQYKHEEVPPLSVWQSPLPYIAVIALIVLVIGFQL